MLQDVAELCSVQLGICGYCRKAGMPRGVEHVEVVNRILCGDNNPVARLQAKAFAQCGGEPRGATRKLSIIAHHPLTQPDSGQTGIAPARALEPQREIHSAKPSLLVAAGRDEMASSRTRLTSLHGELQ